MQVNLIKTGCEICGGPHLSKYCQATNLFPSQEEVDYLGNQQRNQNNAYSNTYNYGWRNHPNFSWKSQNTETNQPPPGLPYPPQRPSDPYNQQNLQIQNPPSFQSRGQISQNTNYRPSTSQNSSNSIEDILSKIVEFSEKRHLETEAILRNQKASLQALENQLGQIVELLSKEYEESNQILDAETLTIAENSNTWQYYDEEEENPDYLNLSNNDFFNQDELNVKVGVEVRIPLDNQINPIQTVPPFEELLINQSELLQNKALWGPELLEREDVENCADEILDYLENMLNHQPTSKPIENLDIHDLDKITIRTINIWEMIPPTMHKLENSFVPGDYHNYYPHLETSLGYTNLISSY